MPENNEKIVLDLSMIDTETLRSLFLRLFDRIQYIQETALQLEPGEKIDPSKLPDGLFTFLWVKNIAERNAVEDKIPGMLVHVIDASDDPTVAAGWVS